MDAAALLREELARLCLLLLALEGRPGPDGLACPDLNMYSDGHKGSATNGASK